jgi:hypothetical protein
VGGTEWHKGHEQLGVGHFDVSGRGKRGLDQRSAFKVGTPVMGRNQTGQLAFGLIGDEPLQGQPDPWAGQDDGVFTLAMRELRERAAKVHDKRMQELAYLANVLAAGCSIEGRSLRPFEAAHAAVAACNLGIEYMLRSEGFRATAVERLEREGADKLFRIGWQLLTHAVVLPAARAFKKMLVVTARREKLDGGRVRTLEQAVRALQSATATGKPWTARGKLIALEGEIDTAALATLLALMDECPSLRGKLKSGTHKQARATELQFIFTSKQIDEVQRFLAGL